MPSIFLHLFSFYLQIWQSNIPENKIGDRNGHQGWMKEGPYFVFPDGGTMFPEGSVKYIEKLGQYIPARRGILRTALDMGCGVGTAILYQFLVYVFFFPKVVHLMFPTCHFPFVMQVGSFAGYMLAEQILTLSFAARDSHKTQTQFVLERGIPAFVAMLGTRRLPFPAFAFDIVHCSWCLIPFNAYSESPFLHHFYDVHASLFCGIVSDKEDDFSLQMEHTLLKWIGSFDRVDILLFPVHLCSGLNKTRNGLIFRL